MRNEGNSLGIAAACINSNQDEEENLAIIEKAKNREIKILYIAPERQENSDWIEATRSIKLSMIVVDEAHCISVWGLDTESRIETEQGLLNNRWKCVISTNALRMDIDKPDIRFIIHTQIPQSPIHYYQEIGRAGRDGLPTDIILFYNPEDKRLPLAFIDGGRPSVKKYEQVIKAIHNEPLGEKDLMRN